MQTVSVMRNTSLGNWLHCRVHVGTVARLRGSRAKHLLPYAGSRTLSGPISVMFLPLPKLACIQLPFPLCLLLSFPTSCPPPNHHLLPSPILQEFELISEIVIQEKKVTQTKHRNQMSSWQEGHVCPLIPVFVLPSFLFKLLLWVGHCAQSGNIGTCETWHFCPGSGNRHVEKSL